MNDGDPNMNKCAHGPVPYTPTDAGSTYRAHTDTVASSVGKPDNPDSDGLATADDTLTKLQHDDGAGVGDGDAADTHDVAAIELVSITASCDPTASRQAIVLLPTAPPPPPLLLSITCQLITTLVMLHCDPPPPQCPNPSMHVNADDPMSYELNTDT